MAANQLLTPLTLGWTSILGTNSASIALSSSTNQIWLAMQVVLSETKTLSKVRLFLSAKTGSPTTAGCTCDLYSDASGIPGSSTEGPISADSIPAAGNWMQWTFAGTSVLTAGTPYWFVWKNSTGTPASNFPTYQWAGNGSGLPAISAGVFNIAQAALFYGWNKVQTANAGTAWATSGQIGVAGPRLEFTDATFAGLPAQSSTRPSSGTTGDRAFGKQEVGVRFNVPANATFNVKGLSFFLSKISTPGALRFRLYSGTTLLATTNSIPAANVSTVSTGDWYTAYFSSDQQLSSSGNPYRAVFGDVTAADANTVGYNGQLITIDSDSNSLALKPMDGTLQKTIIPDNTASPVVPTDTTTDILPFLLLLNTNGEFTSAGGGGVSGARIFSGF